MSSSDCNWSREVVARKPHRCDECRSQIFKGERHSVSSGIFDNVPYRTRLCLPCSGLRIKLYDPLLDEGVEIGGLYEAIMNSTVDIHPDDANAFMARWRENR